MGNAGQPRSRDVFRRISRPTRGECSRHRRHAHPRHRGIDQSAPGNVPPVHDADRPPSLERSSLDLEVVMQDRLEGLDRATLGFWRATNVVSWSGLAVAIAVIIHQSWIHLVPRIAANWFGGVLGFD